MKDSLEQMKRLQKEADRLMSGKTQVFLPDYMIQPFNL